jgi:O-antigen ligase
MKTNLVTHICFLFPFISVIINLQSFTAILISETLSQLIAYGNLGLLILGIALVIKKTGELSKTVRLFIIFFIIYFSFAILASAIHYNPADILANIVPFIYLISFFYYLSQINNRRIFKIVAIISLVLSAILTIHLYNINFDVEYGGIAKYKVDRAQGVYGDANMTALMAIIAFIFLFKLYNPRKYFYKILKSVLLGIVFYSLFLTFSTTGFLVFIISLVILNYKFFTGTRLIIAIIVVPFFYLTLINLNTITADFDLRGQQRDKITNLVNVLTFNTEEVDDSGRNELVTRLLKDYVFVNPFIGNGLGFANSKRGHNTLVGVWADAGIFTVLFFLFMLFKYFTNTINSPPSIRYFVLPILFGICIFMLSMQSIINKGHLLTIFVYLGYLIDEKNEYELLYRPINKTIT